MILVQFWYEKFRTKHPCVSHGFHGKDKTIFITVNEAAQKWNVSEQLVRRYLQQHRIPDAVRDGKNWLIPMDAKKPASASRESIPLPPLAAKLVKQRNKRVRNGIYAYVQINLTYSNNRMASNRLERQQV